MHYIPFIVNDEPYCLWGFDLEERNREFLKGLDADYFEYCLNLYSESEDDKRASVAIRLTLHHALETLYSLIGAYIQAPHCAYAWIAKCSTSDLRNLISRVNRGDKTIHTALNIPMVDWNNVANSVLTRYLSGTEKQLITAQKFSSLWSALAHYFLKQVNIDEYNSLKHGFRSKLGGFGISVGMQSERGKPAPESEMQLLGKSDYGATFFRLEAIGKQSSRNIRSVRTSANWSIERDTLLLQLVYMSINNVISALKIANEWPASECLFLRPENDEDFDKPWHYSPSVMNANFDHVINEANTTPFTKEEIINMLQ